VKLHEKKLKRDKENFGDFEREPDFSITEELGNVKKLSNLWGFIPPGMDEGMKSNARIFAMI